MTGLRNKKLIRRSDTSWLARKTYESRTRRLFAEDDRRERRSHLILAHPFASRLSAFLEHTPLMARVYQDQPTYGIARHRFARLYARLSARDANPRTLGYKNRRPERVASANVVLNAFVPIPLFPLTPLRGNFLTVVSFRDSLFCTVD